MINTSAIDIYVGNKIRERRKQLQLSQNDLARILGISYQQVQKYESGQTQLTLNRLFQVAHALNATPAFFHDGAPAEENNLPDSPELLIGRSPKTLHILLVEDSSSDELLFRRAIAKLGAAVEITSINQSDKVMDYICNCETKYGKPLPDLIVLDIHMPKINGFDLLKNIKNNQAFSHIPVIMLTNSIRTEDMEKSYKLHANSFIQKPAEFDDYSQLVSSLVEYWAKTTVLPSVH